MAEISEPQPGMFKVTLGEYGNNGICDEEEKTEEKEQREDHEKQSSQENRASGDTSGSSVTVVSSSETLKLQEDRQELLSALAT